MEHILNNINLNLIFNNKTHNLTLINFIKSESNKSINEYNLSLIDLYKKYKKLYKFQNMYLFIIYKDNKIYTIFNTGDNRKKIIIENVKKSIINLKKKFKKLPNLFIPFYVSDTHFYHDNDFPFFVEAKPKNKKGILYPDQNYYNINIDDKNINYDQFKNILIENNCSNIKNKIPIIYFSGANTGADKHNIRMKMKELKTDFKDKKYKIHIKEKYVPMYHFCKYKYLLNLPGNQPWSYRMTKILLMNSLIFNVSVLQRYIYEKNGIKIIDKNDKWIQFYSEYFKSGKDYINIDYEWTEGLTSDKNVINIYKEINKLFNFFEKNTDEYIKITNNANKKANSLNIDIFDKTFEYLILQFNKKIYEQNSILIINNFLDKIISSEKNIKQI